MRKPILFLVALGISLHSYTVLFRAEDGMSEFLLGLLLWSSMPYFVLLVLLRWKRQIRVLCAALTVVLLDFGIHVRVFVFPQSSTDALALLWMPLWNFLFSIPVGIIIGVAIEEFAKKRKKPVGPLPSKKGKSGVFL